VSSTVFNGHPIRRVGYRNTVAFFLRLPDGNPEGTGYADTGRQSLSRLHDGAIAMLSAIDGSASYRGWDDVTATLRALIDHEHGDAGAVTLHVPELNPAINPDDHADHRMTALAALAAAAHLSSARRFHHPGYACNRRPENLSAHERDMKCAVYAVTLAGVLAFGHPTAWRHYDRAFAGRDYVRVEDKAEDSDK